MEYIKLCDVCDFQGGSQPPKDEWSIDSKDGYIRMLQIRDFTQGDRATPEYVKLTSTTKICDKDDILIARYGASLGKVLTGLAGAYNVAIMRTIPDTKKIEKKYLYYYLKSFVFQRFLASVGNRAAQAGFNKNDLQELLIPDISKEEQLSIVKLLGKIEAIMDTRQQQLTRLDDLIKSRFVEMFGDPVSNPFCFEKEHLGQLCDVRDGTHDSPKYFTTGYPLVTSKNITNGMIDLTEASLINEQDYIKINERSKVDVGDILMPMIGTVGKPIIVDIEPNFAIKNVSLIKFKNDSKVINIYIRALLQSDYFDNAIISKVRGGTQKFISLGDIRKLEILVPPLEVQNQFAGFVKQIDKSKFAVQRSLDKTQELFDSLMQKYFG